MTEQARGKVEVNPEECNGCGLCVESCPLKSFKLSEERNHSGARPVQHLGEDCWGCGTCHYFCPEPRAITVNRLDKHDRELCDAPAA
jgi:2-oxoglutarate ferredoxin oxidoreductase subunit delta